MELEMEFCIVLEQTVLMMPQTCLQVDPKPVYQLSKLDLTNRRTNGWTDICDSRAAFAAEKLTMPCLKFPLCNGLVEPATKEELSLV